MKIPAHRTCLIACLLFVSISLPACSTLRQRLPEDRRAEKAAEQLLVDIGQTNQNLNSFKGIGKIRIWGPQHPPINQRVAWIGSVPVSLRIVVLASGQPVVKFATDGRYLYFIDLQNPEHSYKKIRAEDASLAKLIAIPVKSSDIISLLAGRPPILEHSRAVLAEDAANSGTVLILEKWWQVVEKIYLNADKSAVEKVETFGGGKLRFRVEFKRMQQIKGYRVPRRLIITGNDGTGLQLDIDRYIADVSLKPSMFVLTPPEETLLQ
jgi:hypothetical protein